eukprot:TRINITY_DN35059_c0_g1_i1.p1 TRINITY_DN35059_c0_g1~~TRINITY_DN35059_c0_g1_i1.p1  ORF type:complete len:177 (-),score=33.15 TRINITY_DN35059_c0_g1_i1:125-655(-)
MSCLCSSSLRSIVAIVAIVSVHASTSKGVAETCSQASAANGGGCPSIQALSLIQREAEKVKRETGFMKPDQKASHLTNLEAKTLDGSVARAKKAKQTAAAKMAALKEQVKQETALHATADDAHVFLKDVERRAHTNVKSGKDNAEHHRALRLANTVRMSSFMKDAFEAAYVEVANR